MSLASSLPSYNPAIFRQFQISSRKVHMMLHMHHVPIFQLQDQLKASLPISMYEISRHKYQMIYSQVTTTTRDLILTCTGLRIGGCSLWLARLDPFKHSRSENAAAAEHWSMISPLTCTSAIGHLCLAWIHFLTRALGHDVLLRESLVSEAWAQLLVAELDHRACSKKRRVQSSEIFSSNASLDIGIPTGASWQPIDYTVPSISIPSDPILEW